MTAQTPETQSSDPPTIYKVLAEDGTACHGGSGKWFLPKGERPGKWMPVIKNIVPCHRGYHLCEGETDLVAWLGPVIWIAEYRGEQVRDEDKIVVGEARLVSHCGNWNERTAQLFAADCAEDVLHLYERDYPNDDRPRRAIQAARDFAEGRVSEAATAAARAAAWVAARAAARDAAWDAAWVAARAAARDAAWNTARDAASAAAWAATSLRQSNHLRKLLTGELYT